MISAILFPQSPLDNFIESIFYYRSFEPDHILDRLLPDGYVHLLFELNGQPQCIYDNDTLAPIQTCRDAWISGFRTKPITIPSGKDSEMIVVQFRKGRAFPFFRVMMYELTDIVVQAEDAMKYSLVPLWNQLVGEPAPEGKVKMVEAYFMHYYHSDLFTNPFTDFALTCLEKKPTPLSMQTIVDKVGFSQKHLIRLFKDFVGVTPRDYRKVQRFQKVVQCLEVSREIHWTHLALDSGYYDQSHFIADFKTFSGYTPLEYLRLKGQQLNYIPVG